MLVNEQESSSLPSIVTQDLAQAIKGALVELSHSYTRVDSEKALQKDIFDKMKKEHSLPRSALTKMAKMYHAASLAQEAAKDEEFYEFSRAVFSMIGAPGVGLLEHDDE
jgi:hypothetical protein